MDLLGETGLFVDVVLEGFGVGVAVGDELAVGGYEGWSGFGGGGRGGMG